MRSLLLISFLAATVQLSALATDGHGEQHAKNEAPPAVSAATTSTASNQGKPDASPPATPEQMKTLVAELRAKKLGLPIKDADVEALKGGFYQGRPGHLHRAVDFMSARGTPILAVQDGTVQRLFESKAGGLTIYETDPSNRFTFYYAHLNSYAKGLANGDHVTKGQTIGFVGSTGDADSKAPHLHLGIWQYSGKDFWDGITVDPYEVFKKTGETK